MCSTFHQYCANCYSTGRHWATSFLGHLDIEGVNTCTLGVPIFAKCHRFAPYFIIVLLRIYTLWWFIFLFCYTFLTAIRIWFWFWKKYVKSLKSAIVYGYCAWFAWDCLGEWIVQGKLFTSTLPRPASMFFHIPFNVSSGLIFSLWTVNRVVSDMEENIFVFRVGHCDFEVKRA